MVFVRFVFLLRLRWVLFVRWCASLFVLFVFVVVVFLFCFRSALWLSARSVEIVGSVLYPLTVVVIILCIQRGC